MKSATGSPTSSSAKSSINQTTRRTQVSKLMASLLRNACYNFVPKRTHRNVKFRGSVLQKAARTPEYRRLFKDLCRHNVLFFINAFCWTLDTRKTKSGTMSPFVTFEVQDKAVRKIGRAIFPPPGAVQHGIVIEKSRDMGGTWLCAMILLHAVLFYPGTVEFFCMSYKADVVDGTFASIMGKMRLVLKYLPSWLLPEKLLTMPKLLIQNNDTGSSIKGSTTTDDSGVSGRYTAMFFDEFSLVPESEAHQLWAKSSACADCRIVNGTHRGSHLEFARIVKNARMTDLIVNDRAFMEKVQLAWWDHPEKAKGIELRHGKRWSRWYESECVRLGWNKQQIAQELDMDPQAAGWQFFEGAEIDRLIRKYASEPLGRGVLVGEQFQSSGGGHLYIWFKPGANGLPPKGRYGIGNDVASGLGGKESTPSCMSVVNLETGEKVAEFRDPHLYPQRFAACAAKIGRWFYMATMIWEKKGPGSAFGKALVQEECYPNVYMGKKKEGTLSPEIGQEPGWTPSVEANRMMLEQFREDLSSGHFFNPSELALKETMNFIYGEDGVSVDHALKLVKGDPSGAKANHGDQVIADALADILVREDGTVSRNAKIKVNPEAVLAGAPPYGSMAWRDMMEELEGRGGNDGWGRD